MSDERKKPYLHQPVMCQEVITCLQLAPGKIIIDATVGEGGHSEEILKKILPGGRLVAIDQDADVLALARERLKEFGDSVTLRKSNFRNLGEIFSSLKIGEIDGILFDLGASAYQLETPLRGFSIKHDAPLDMRMDRSGKISAFDLVNNLTRYELSTILKNYGEERWAGRIARTIEERRKKAAIVTTGQLAELVCRTVPFSGRKRIHPATRVFQALRIAVNRELEILPEALDEAVFYLRRGGRICVISFHSLEDRIVKHQFRKMVRQGKLKLITKKPIVPRREEIVANPRSRSAKLRVGERT